MPRPGGRLTERKCPEAAGAKYLVAARWPHRVARPGCGKSREETAEIERMFRFRDGAQGQN